jgi:magnesium-transporting ATPase (P-type)
MRPASISGATGSSLVLLTTVLYLVVIDSQGNADTRRVTAWVVTLVTCASLGTLASWSCQPRVRSIILAVTAGALLGLGLLGIFSIGLLLVAAGVLLSVAAMNAVAEDRSGSLLLPSVLGAIAFAGVPTLLLWIV